MAFFRTLAFSTVTIAAVALAACGGPSNPWASQELDLEGLRAIVASSVLTVGDNRLVVGVLDGDGPIAASSVSARFFYLEGDPEERGSATLEFAPVDDTGRGYFIGRAAFDAPGQWGVEVRAAGSGDVARAFFAVAPESDVPAPGQPAPESVSRTLGDAPLAELSSDVDPEPALYELTVAEAVTSGQPAVIAFATPALCQTQTCGPAVDIIKLVRPGYVDRVAFVHVEIYADYDSAEPQRVAAVDEWNLPTEPWVFVTDADGLILARFEGVLTERELREALDEALR